MQQFILDCAANDDSTGGRCEVLVRQPPPNRGEPVFGKLKSRLAQAVMSVGAVTGFSYGAGFGCASLGGREYVADRSHFGGILGGISTGENIQIAASIKPTSSVGGVAASGRHDPCIVPRVVPVLEAMVAVTLADLYLQDQARAGGVER